MIQLPRHSARWSQTCLLSSFLSFCLLPLLFYCSSRSDPFVHFEFSSFWSCFFFYIQVLLLPSMNDMPMDIIGSLVSFSISIYSTLHQIDLFGCVNHDSWTTSFTVVVQSQGPVEVHSYLHKMAKAGHTKFSLDADLISRSGWHRQPWLLTSKCLLHTTLWLRQVVRLYIGSWYNTKAF